jgi:transposase
MSLALEKEVQELRQQVTLQSQKITNLEQILTHTVEEYENLIHSFLDAQRRTFGKKSERFIDSQQQLLFEQETDQNKLLNSSTDQNTEEITYTRKKKKSKQANLDLLPQREEIISVDDSKRVCRCGTKKQVIGYEQKRILNYQPAIFEVINQKREIMGCKKGCEQSMVTAPCPKHILPKCRASESLLAHIAVSKVLDRQPLYHLENKIEREHGWRIPRQTMARWLIQLSEKLQILVNLMKDEIIKYDSASIDATTLQVLNEPNRSAEIKSQAYCIRGGPPDKRVTLFEYNGDYHPKRYSQSDYVVETLADFSGILSCDASPVFDQIGAQLGVTLSYCHAHARRKFEAIEKTRTNRKGKSSKPGLAHYVLKHVYQSLYRIEKEMKKEKFDSDQIKQHRHLQSKPILDNWYNWLVEHKELTLKESPIGKAIQYALNNWTGLNTFLTDGRIEIDNNSTERNIRPFVIARKNFLFSSTQAGADSLGIHFSLILTAKHHCLDPYRYYVAILKQLPLCQKMDDYINLLPWNFKNIS